METLVELIAPINSVFAQTHVDLWDDLHRSLQRERLILDSTLPTFLAAAQEEEVNLLPDALRKEKEDLRLRINAKLACQRPSPTRFRAPTLYEELTKTAPHL